MPDDIDPTRTLRKIIEQMTAEFNRPNWHNKRRTFGDAVRCLLGLHQTARDGRDSSGLYVERCSCGATRLNHRRPWIREAWWSRPRKGWR